MQGLRSSFSTSSGPFHVALAFLENDSDREACVVQFDLDRFVRAHDERLYELISEHQHEISMSLGDPDSDLEAAVERELDTGFVGYVVIECPKSPSSALMQHVREHYAPPEEAERALEAHLAK